MKLYHYYNSEGETEHVRQRLTLHGNADASNCVFFCAVIRARGVVVELFASYSVDLHHSLKKSETLQRIEFGDRH